MRILKRFRQRERITGDTLIDEELRKRESKAGKKELKLQKKQQKVEALKQDVALRKEENKLKQEINGLRMEKTKQRIEATGIPYIARKSSPAARGAGRLAKKFHENVAANVRASKSKKGDRFGLSKDVISKSDKDLFSKSKKSERKLI